MSYKKPTHPSLTWITYPYPYTVAALWLATIPPLKKKYKKKSFRIHFLTVYSTYIEVSGTYFIFSFDPRLNDLSQFP